LRLLLLWRIAAGPGNKMAPPLISEGAKCLLTIHAISVAAHGGLVNGEATAGPPNKVQARSGALLRATKPEA
jgi:hypothetical protein